MSSVEREYFTFMGEYSAFLEKMLDDERGKFLALQSKELARIEQSIVVSQANAKKLENYEAKRFDLQTKAGYADLSFRQILDKQDNTDLRTLRTLYDSFERNVQEIRFFNNKSMVVAKDNLQQLNPTATLPGTAKDGAHGSDSYTRLTQGEDNSSGLLQSKA